ncbi:hypothetical protein X771_11430 [Mesorhizobium sp. LSJC277A00]|nr:hypothetical protein X771_11430 [Mesorhizobium sp. LSJC277A00]
MSPARVRQQGHWPAAFEIADNRPVSLTAPQCKVVNADHGEFITRLFSPAGHDAT